jgi:hypothetical protein
VDDVDAGPEAHGLTGPGRAEPKLPLRDHQVPGRRDDAIELDRTGSDRLAGARVDGALGGRRVGRLRDRRQLSGEPQRQQLALLGRRRLEALSGRDRRLGVERLVGRSAL